MNRQPNGKRPFASKGTPRRPSAPRESTGLSTGARRLALEVLTDVHRNGAYASLALGERLRNAACRRRIGAWPRASSMAPNTRSSVSTGRWIG